MNRLRLVSFLAESAGEHYRQVGTLAARACGLTPGAFEEPGLARLDETLAEQGPALIFLCGLPYTRQRDAGSALEPLAAPVPESEDVAVYYAELVTRAGLKVLDQTCLMAYNGVDSFSGWLLPRSGLSQKLYSRTVCSGSHRSSLRMLVSGEADAAAVDSTVRALEAHADADIAALPVVERVGPVPSPPVAIANGTPELARMLRSALTSLQDDPLGRIALEAGLVRRYEPVADSVYDPVRKLDAARHQA